MHSASLAVQLGTNMSKHELVGDSQAWSDKMTQTLTLQHDMFISSLTVQVGANMNWSMISQDCATK